MVRCRRFGEPSLPLDDIMTRCTHIYGGQQSDFGCADDKLKLNAVVVEEETLCWTHPEAGEVGIGGIVGLVVSLHQTGDDLGLLLVQTWPHRLSGCLLLFPLHYHVLLPLNLLVGQDDCKRGWNAG